MAKSASSFDRLSVLETRAGKRSSIIWRLYLPVIFFVYGVLLGKNYHVVARVNMYTYFFDIPL